MRAASTLLAFFLVAATWFAAVPIQADAPETCGDKTLFQNDDVRLWFHTYKGLVKVSDTNGSDDESVAVFQYATSRLSEVADGEELAYAKLNNAAPQTSVCVVERSEEWVNVTLTTTESVKVGHEFFPATVAFAWHFNTTSHGAKFDLDVLAWPWQSDASELVFDFSVGASSGTIEAAENGIGYRDENGQARGYVEWAPNATAMYADGTNQTAIVDSDTTLNEQANHADVTLRFTNVTAGYGRLVYDPWVGAGNYVIVAGVLLVGLAPIEQLAPKEIAALLNNLL